MSSVSKAKLKKMHDFFDYPFPLPLAHRGGDEKKPENTLAAFRDAYQLGYRYFETDVHYTVDHELIAFHDSDLKRTLGLSHSIEDLTQEQRLRLKKDSSYAIPLIEELLTTFPDVYFHIDAKHKSAVEPLVRAIQQSNAENRVCLASFSPSNLKRLRLLLPGVPTITNRYEIAGLRYGLPLIKDPPPGSRNLSIPTHILYNRERLPLISKRAVMKLHDKGCRVYIWTINSAEEMNRLLDMGVDGIISDKLRILKEVLQSRSQWVDP